MSRLNQISNWNKQTQYKKLIKQKNFFDVFLSFFFAIASNTSPLGYAIQSENETRVDGTKNVF